MRRRNVTVRFVFLRPPDGIEHVRDLVVGGCTRRSADGWTTPRMRSSQSPDRSSDCGCAAPSCRGRHCTSGQLVRNRHSSSTPSHSRHTGSRWRRGRNGNTNCPGHSRPRSADGHGCRRSGWRTRIRPVVLSGSVSNCGNLWKMSGSGHCGSLPCGWYHMKMQPYCSSTRLGPQLQGPGSACPAGRECRCCRRRVPTASRGTGTRYGRPPPSRRARREHPGCLQCASRT